MKISRSLLRSITAFTLCCLSLTFLAHCSKGRGPSILLRQGQAPIYDFPMYVTEGAPGNVWKYQYDRTRTLLVSGLQDPRGIATDRYNNLYVVEQGANQLLKVDANSGAKTVLLGNLQTPSVVAVDSVGQVYVCQDGNMSITRVNDGKVISTFTARPSGLVFGVNDLMVYSLYDNSQVFWGLNGQSSSSTTNPVQVSTDATGRIYVAEGTTVGAHIWRFNQRDPGNATVVADTLQALSGMAVDPVGNIYAIEQGASRIDLVSFDGKLYTWVSDTIDPQYLALTQN